MSEATEFHVEVVRIGPIEKHPNADSLSVTKVYDYPVIFRSGDYKEGDRAVYLPVDSVVAPNDPRFDFLGDHRRIRAKRLRGIFSMGLLTPADPDWQVGEDVAERLHVTKYEPLEEGVQGDPRIRVAHADDDVDPGILPIYGVEALRRNKGVLVDGEDVLITEKIHGENARFVHDGERLHVGSRTRFKKLDSENAWTRAARKYDLATKLANIPGVGIYGEVHGYTRGFPYGVPVGEVGLRLFDAIKTKTREFFGVDDFLNLAQALRVPTVPILHSGPWSPELRALAEGPSTIGGHVREGFVVRPTAERVDRSCGRVILKLHGEGFLLRKGG